MAHERRKISLRHGPFLGGFGCFASPLAGAVAAQTNYAITKATALGAGTVSSALHASYHVETGLVTVLIILALLIRAVAFEKRPP